MDQGLGGKFQLFCGCTWGFGKKVDLSTEETVLDADMSFFPGHTDAQNSELLADEERTHRKTFMQDGPPQL